jgi:hypothetical protein
MSKQEWLVVNVIGVEKRLGQLLEKKINNYSTYSEKTEYTYASKDAPPRTLVLYTANGELKTKEFDGDWTYEQVGEWNKERFIDDEPIE